ncbi:uncharacterized protein N7484_000113 [Penicillium longicatenatum]|uniref:uncharacterized protein n=1 Tax=Penicillium longicatenatum TaxID=1561947 RepID=UPI0025488D31|nr:uncharacterized protein N7484_000113 [Penicillium longicatenatum]KAJ5660741.1 hypothetical protein N7484_000113 [Penicillium longicatenatum]
MPGLSDPADLVAAGWRKRKRDHEDSATLVRPSAFAPFRVDRPDRETCPLPLSRHPTDTGDHSFRPRCLPRKRRHVQPPYLTLPAHQQSSLLSPNIYASAQGPYSPPVSPRTVPISYQSTSPSALRPCHICHRRPTTRQVLDAYADCDLCGERACFICLRQCDAPACRGVPGHPETPGESDIYSPEGPFDLESTDSRRKICSSCAVEGITETGTEIVQCLDCVRGHSANWPAGSMAPGWTLDAMNHDRMIG